MNTKVLLQVRVIPNAKSNSLSVRDGVAVARIAAKPRDNEANNALEEFLSEFFSCTAKVTRGFKARQKQVILNGSMNAELLNKFAACFENLR